MKKLLWLAAVAMIASSVAFADAKVAVLDGTSWKLEVKPDAMSRDKGEKDFRETMTFADGNVSLKAPKVGTESSSYSVTPAGEKDYTFKTERNTFGEGGAVWTGTTHGKSVDGKLIWTKNDGSVLTYTFQGTRLD